MMDIEQCITYPCNLQMYIVPPTGKIRSEELREWCIDRVRVLKLVEEILMKNYKKTPVQCAETLIHELENNGIHEFANLINIHNYSHSGVEHFVRYDCASHFILRSAFSFEQNKKKWFVKYETKLFAWRLSFLDKDNVKMLLDLSNLQYSIVSSEEIEQIKDDLILSSVENVANIKFYKTSFNNVIRAVKKRHVYIKNGIAYVPETKMFWLIIPAFNKTLINGFANARVVASNTYGNLKITEILGTLSSLIKTRSFKCNYHNDVPIDQLDELSRTSYPLCMRLLHEALRTKHHLTNGGRVQYCLFLKGIGLSLNNAIQFWKDEFTKTVDERTFEREYKYYIKHLYGEVGRRAKYEPSPCFKIFKAEVGLKDNHGCPYKHMELHILKSTLTKCGLIRSGYQHFKRL
ncbi:DNA primase large subunit isoform X2 [Megalopta genalis]|uniref:DNA primase large subunit isoform X2 n=1 Tax=Megalopta genalis TaxID=115081 RepID=UPI003FD2F332